MLFVNKDQGFKCLCDEKNWETLRVNPWAIPSLYRSGGIPGRTQAILFIQASQTAHESRHPKSFRFD